MTREHFRELVEEAIDSIPRASRARCATSASSSRTSRRTSCSTKWRSRTATRCSASIRARRSPSASWGHGNQLPDRITLFQQPIEDECDGDEDEIVVAIGETLIHELGHYFGMSEEEIDGVEERTGAGAVRRRDGGDESAQAVRAALPRAGVGQQAGRGGRPRRPTIRFSRSVRAAARSRGRWRRRPDGCWPSKSIAISRPISRPRRCRTSRS